MSVREKLAKRALDAGLILSATENSALCGYFELLAAWNQRISLTSLPVSEVADLAIDRLLIEPARAGRELPHAGIELVDIGSGGGSPAIPMKIVAPQTSLRMVESRSRKTAFLREAVRQLGLENTVVDRSRAEDLADRPELVASIDVVTIRAVRPDQELLRILSALLKRDGLLFMFGTSEPQLGGAPAGFELKRTVQLLPDPRSCLLMFRKS